MSNPRDLIARAGNRHSAARPAHPEIRSVAPAPMRAESVAPTERIPTPTLRLRPEIQPQPVQTGGVYRELMRRHDRMAPRHLHP